MIPNINLNYQQKLKWHQEAFKQMVYANLLASNLTRNQQLTATGQAIWSNSPQLFINYSTTLLTDINEEPLTTAELTDSRVDIEITLTNDYQPLKDNQLLTNTTPAIRWDNLKVSQPFPNKYLLVPQFNNPLDKRRKEYNLTWSSPVDIDRTLRQQHYKSDNDANSKPFLNVTVSEFWHLDSFNKRHEFMIRKHYKVVMPLGSQDNWYQRNQRHFEPRLKTVHTTAHELDENYSQFYQSTITNYAPELPSVLNLQQYGDLTTKLLADNETNQKFHLAFNHDTLRHIDDPRLLSNHSLLFNNQVLNLNQIEGYPFLEADYDRILIEPFICEECFTTSKIQNP